jgi:hypothetical protein
MAPRDSREKSASHKANKRLDRHTPCDRPEDRLWSIDAVAALCHRSVRTIWNILSEKAALFDEPLYDKLRAGDGNQRMYRVISTRDLGTFKRLFPLYRRKPRVKKKRG